MELAAEPPRDHADEEEDDDDDGALRGCGGEETADDEEDAEAEAEGACLDDDAPLKGLLFVTGLNFVKGD